LGNEGKGDGCRKHADSTRARSGKVADMTSPSIPFKRMSQN
jgi:hypothetical protein